MVADWQRYFHHIFCINLKKRTDRLERVQYIFQEYGIDATIYEGIECEKGAVGLVLTMKKLFTECLDNGIDRVLVFEDDVKMLHDPYTFHNTMNKCVEDLKRVDWQQFYLGTQHPKPFFRWETENILPVELAFSTHAVAYGKRAMEAAECAFIDEPIDNWWVREFQKYNLSFCSYPILCTQEAMYSDIGNDYIDWDVYITPTFERHVRPILHDRFKKQKV